MNKRISEKRAASLVIIILSLVIVFHLLVLINIIPYNMVWGGKIEDTSRLFKLEAISIAVNLLMLVIVLMKAKIISVVKNQRVVTISLWIMAILFMINTVGNALSTNDFERFVFTPLTLVLSLLCFRLALSKATK